MSTLYGKYLSMLCLVKKLSSISLQLTGKTEPPLLDCVKLIVSTYYIPTRIYQSSYKNTESNSDREN